MAEGGRGAIAGVLAAAVGLGVAEVGAGAIPTTSTVVAVGHRIIELGPPSMERRVIDAIGTADKPALVIAVLMVIGLLGALAGILARHRPPLAGLVVAVVTAAGAAAAMEETDASWVHALPALAGGLASFGTLMVLTRAAKDEPVGPLRPDAAGRRTFLLAGSAAAVVAAAAAATGRALQGRIDATASRLAVRLPRVARPLPPTPSGAALDVEGISSYITPNNDFYRIDTSLVVPQIETAGWTLRIHGLADDELELTYDDLLARPLVEADITIACVSNPVGGHLVGNARWLGVPLAELLDEVGPSDDADQVVGRAGDDFTVGFPLRAALDGRDALVAVGMNGEPLPLRHGFPARLVVAGLYGYVSATKWLREIELTRFDHFDPYWVRRGWSRLGPVKVASRIDTPRGQQDAGTMPVAGVAWATAGGIKTVEVRVDKGPWHEATLGTANGLDTWRQWRWDWDAEPGVHQLQVRATTVDGEVQTEERADVFPDGATGWHTLAIKVRD